MTRDEWQAELVRLCVEAIDAADAAPFTEGAFIVTAKGRGLVLAHLRERMAQAAQRIVAERDALREAADSRGYMDGLAEQRDEERERLDRVDATARAVYAAHIVRFGYASFIGAYENAQALEETRAEWLAKRGQR